MLKRAHEEDDYELPRIGSTLPVASPALISALSGSLMPVDNGQPVIKEKKPKIKEAKDPNAPKAKRGRKKKDELLDEAISFSHGVSARGRERKPKQFGFADEQAQFAYSLNASNSQRYQKRIKGDAYDDGELITLKNYVAPDDAAEEAPVAEVATADAVDDDSDDDDDEDDE